MKKNIIRGLIIGVTSVLVLLLVGCGLMCINNAHILKPLPEDSKWYCEELRIEIDFQSDTEKSAKQYTDSGSYYILPIQVDWFNRFHIERGWDVILMGDFDWKDNVLTIYNETENNRAYVFTRIEE